MNPQQFIEDLKELNLSLDLKQGNLALRGYTNNLSQDELRSILDKNKDVLTSIKEHKEDLKTYLSTVSGHKLRRKQSKNVVSVYPLSPLQQGMLFHSLYQGDHPSGAYINQFSCDFWDLNVECFRKSWDYLLDAHTILRTAFHHEEFDLPLQAVYKKVSIPFEEIDISKLTESAQKAWIQAFLEQDRIRGFKMDQPPLMRITVLRLNEQKHRLIWTNHHILSDGWSTPIMMTRVLECYKALVENKVVKQYPVDKYEDYIRYIESRNKEKQEFFWSKYLSSIEGPTLLPFIRDSIDRNKGGANVKQVDFRLDPDASAKLHTFATQHRITINTIVQAVWAYLLSRYTGQSTITYGVIVSGRPPELSNSEDRVGLYINTIPLCTSIDRDQSLFDWLKELQKTHAQSREFQFTALSSIQKWVNIQGDFFDTILTFENYPVGDELVNDQSQVGGDVTVDERTNYLLELTISFSRTLHVNFLFNDNLLQEEYVHMINGHYQHLLNQIIDNPDIKVKDLCLLPPKELEKVTVQFNNNIVPFPEDRTCLNHFQEKARQNPDAVAVVCQGEQLTYKELDDRSNQIAHHLIEKGIKHDMPVVICMDRSNNMLIGIWSILKAGGAYLPIDPDLPMERVHRLVKDCNSKVLLTSQKRFKTLSELSKIDFVLVDDKSGAFDQYPTSPVNVVVGKQHLAYIIYTSGSTGIPKGVMIDHQGLLNHLYGMVDTLDIDRQSRLLQNAKF